MNNELYQGLEIRNRYILKKHLGSGSFGDVWSAIDKLTEIEIAIKFYIPLDEKGIKQFSEEYKFSFQLNHENLLPATYFDVWNNRPYLVMRYCPYGAVEDKAEQMSETDIWKFIRDVSAGLAYLHAKEPPVIHQDIKPANILIDENNCFLITDFGISRQMRSTMRKQSKRNISGAIGYMAPECFEAEPYIVKASDIWALGASIYELVNGDLPFFGQGGGMMLGNAKMPKLSDKWSQRLNEVMQSCLSAKTWERPTAAELTVYATDVLEGKSPDAVWKVRWEQEESKKIPVPQMTVKKNNDRNINEGEKKSKLQTIKEVINRFLQYDLASIMLKTGLIISLVLSLFLVIIGFIAASEKSADNYWVIFTSLLFMFAPWGYYLLLKWEKWGFWLLWIDYFAIIIWLSRYFSSFNFFTALLFSIISTSIGALFVYAILCLKKKGKSTWEQMDNRFKFLNERLHQRILLFIISINIIMYGYAAWKEKDSDKEIIPIESKLEKEAKTELPTYYLKVEECRGFIGRGSSKDTGALLLAQDRLDQVVSMEKLYSEINKEYKYSEELKPLLQEKLDDAYEAWVKTADDEYTIYKNRKGAIEFYKKALSLKENKNVRRWMEWIEKEENDRDYTLSREEWYKKQKIRYVNVKY